MTNDETPTLVGTDTIGGLVQRYRQAAGISTEELGRRAGVSGQCIERIEADEPVQFDHLQRIAKALGRSVGAFLGGGLRAARIHQDPNGDGPMSADERQAIFQRADAIQRLHTMRPEKVSAETANAAVDTMVEVFEQDRRRLTTGHHQAAFLDKTIVKQGDGA